MLLTQAFYLPSIIKKWLNIALLLIVLSLFSIPTYATTISKIVIFGDSLSDNGNLYSATSHRSWLGDQLCQYLGMTCSKLPVLPMSPPYYQGRFSNGLVWIENVGQMLNLTKSVTEFRDYAFGGAWAEAPGYGGENVAPDDIGVQVSTYMMLYPYDQGKASRDLFVIWAGGNDYLSGRSDVQYATTKTVEAIQYQLHKLIDFGATIFLIPNLPNLGLTPWATTQGTKLAENLTQLSQQHNLKLALMMKKEQSEHPNVKFIAVDVMQYFNELISKRAQYQLSNVNDACYPGNYDGNNAALAALPNAKINKMIMGNVELRVAYSTAQSASAGVQPCANPDNYLFWDHVHPTKVVHQLLANYVVNLLKENGIY